MVAAPANAPTTVAGPVSRPGSADGRPVQATARLAARVGRGVTTLRIGGVVEDTWPLAELTGVGLVPAPFHAVPLTPPLQQVGPTFAFQRLGAARPRPVLARALPAGLATEGTVTFRIPTRLTAPLAVPADRPDGAPNVALLSGRGVGLASITAPERVRPAVRQRVDSF